MKITQEDIDWAIKMIETGAPKPSVARLEAAEQPEKDKDED